MVKRTKVQKEVGTSLHGESPDRETPDGRELPQENPGQERKQRQGRSGRYGSATVLKTVANGVQRISAAATTAMSDTPLHKCEWVLDNEIDNTIHTHYVCSVCGAKSGFKFTKNGGG